MLLVQSLKGKCHENFQEIRRPYLLKKSANKNEKIHAIINKVQHYKAKIAKLLKGQCQEKSVQTETVGS